LNAQKWILENKHPGATSCFILGEIENIRLLEPFKSYNYVIWFVSEKQLPKKFSGYKNIYPMTLESVDSSKLDEIVTTLINENISLIPDIFCSQKILDNHTQSYDLILQTIQIKSEEKLRVGKMRKLEGFSSQKNILNNLPFFIHNQLGDQAENLLLAKPVAVVGAGPSLDCSINILEKYHRDFYIFCVDSAFSKLRNRNIQPDAVFTVDAEKPMDACVNENETIHSLFLSLKSPHEWVTKKETKKYFLSAQILTEDWLAENGCAKTIPRIIGNCGITAVNLALFLGCSPIMLFGLDHSADEKTGQGHASEVNLKISRATYNPNKCKHTVPGNYQPRVKTFLLNEWKKLNELISGTPDSQEIWNITDRGAKYDKAKLIHPEKFIFPKEIKFEKKYIHFKTKCIEQNGFQDLKLQIQQFLRKKGNLVQLILKCNSVNNETCVLLSTLFQEKLISKLLSNFTLKIAPILLNWQSISEDERLEALRETKDMLHEVHSLEIKLQNLSL
jgi:hypothetical protein